MTALEFAPTSSRESAWARVARESRRPLLVFLAIALWTLLVNWPLLRFEDADDGFFLEVAHLWTRGLPPYVASFDVKGPGFFALLAMVVSVFAPTLTTLKLVGVAGSAAGAALLFAITMRLGRPIAILCAALYPILLVVDGDAAYSVMNALLLAAYALALSGPADLGRTLGAGLAVGLACTFKQTCAVDAVAILTFLLARREGGRLPTILAFGVAASLAPLAFFAYFAAIGATGVFLNDVVWTALTRSDGVSFGGALLGLVECLLPGWVAVVALPGALINLRAIAARRPVGDFAIWLAFAFAGLALQRAACRPYVVPTIAPTLALSAAYVDHLFAHRGPALRRGALAVFGALIFAGAMVGHGAAILRKMPVVDLDALALMSASLQGAGAAPSDRLMVLNGAPWLNIVSELAPPTAVFHTDHIQCDFPGAGLRALQAAFAAKPRFVMLVNPTLRPTCESDSIASAIDAGLATGFDVVDAGGTPNTGYRLYELRR